ncbi:hypothetical protein CCHR01_15624 [Colletotrichum chrysophilum]|uniref:Uncharacterized protein n=1 Tax=Colletotrichum chrysophilum TaxID=1836956 RepID=A0AAD9E8I7_9PEZI|nr:hypothetical protein CCHR01_15624 [Colletotrichum chrysophilum]
MSCAHLPEATRTTERGAPFGKSGSHSGSGPPLRPHCNCGDGSSVVPQAAVRSPADALNARRWPVEGAAASHKQCVDRGRAGSASSSLLSDLSEANGANEAGSQQGVCWVLDALKAA